MSDSKVSTSRQQELVVEAAKVMMELRQSGASLKELLKQELIDTDIDLFYIRRGFITKLRDKIFKGIPFWAPRGDFAIWLKEHKPEIYQSSAPSARNQDE